MWRDHLTEIIVFSLLFLLVSAMGFVAAKWRRPIDMAHLDEWGLGGRSFGGWITWFLVGGDLYTAYTFVAVPALIFAITGIVATMPYIALQLVGIEAVLKTMGVTGESPLARHAPIIVAFAILAAYTYQSGLRAPALIAFVKDTLIYIVILVA